LPLLAVGRQTAETARAVGLGDVRAADGDKRQLSELIQACFSPASGPLLYLAGENRAGDLAVGGLEVMTAIAYRAVKAGSFPPAIATAVATGELDGVLHFSRRTAEVYLECAHGAGLGNRALGVRHFCFSRAVAAPLLAAGAPQVQVAPQPDEACLLDLVGSPHRPEPGQPA
jgi:uroporphyrinogen-III synthase